MSFLNASSFNGVYEPQPVVAGEYQLRILSAEDKTGKNPPYVPFMNISLEVVSDPKAKNIYHTLFYPKQGDDEKTVNSKLARIQKFMDAFGIVVEDNFDPKQLIGSVGWAILVEKDDPEFGRKNEIKQVIAPK